MNHCVPSWDHGMKSWPLKLSTLGAHSNSSNISCPPLLVPTFDYEIAELTWENGQLALHGLTPLRGANKASAMSNVTTKYPMRAKTCATGTLESVVLNQATHLPEQKSATNFCGNNVNEVVPWFDHQYPSMVKLKPMTSAPIDALVPCDNNKIHQNDNQEHSPQFVPEISTSSAGYCSTAVGSCSGAGATALDVLPLGINSFQTNNVCESEGATYEGRDSLQVSLDTCERELSAGTTRFTSTYLGSLENTTSAKDYTKTTVEDHDSGCYSISQRKVGEEEGKKKGSGKSSVSTKRSKAAGNHNQSERKRRDEINQKMKALQRLVPNSSKTDKASILDKVIEYVKQLQAQVQLMSRMNTSPMMMQPLAMHRMLMMPPMGVGIGVGMGIMDINNAIGLATTAASMPPFLALANAYMPAVSSWDNSGLPTPASIIPPDPLSAFLGCQSQTMNIDAYNKLAALYLPFQQSPASGSASKF